MDWVQVVRDIGFPVVVALILLIKLDATLNGLRESLDRNTQKLHELIGILRERRKDE